MRTAASTRPPAGAAACAVKETINWLNGSSAFGLLVARAGHARMSRGPRGLLLADGYRFGFPKAGAFTVGNVVITAGDWQRLRLERPELLFHEERHSWQYVMCGGLPFLPAYLLAVGWSVLVTGDPASRNFFEQRAGLALGGYTERPARPLTTAARRLARRFV